MSCRASVVCLSKCEIRSALFGVVAVEAFRFLHGRPPIRTYYALHHSNKNGGPIAGTAACDAALPGVYAARFHRHATRPARPEPRRSMVEGSGTTVAADAKANPPSTPKCIGPPPYGSPVPLSDVAAPVAVLTE